MVLHTNPNPKVRKKKGALGKADLPGFEEEEGELHYQNPPPPCLWQAPASAQKKGGGGQAGHSSGFGGPPPCAPTNRRMAGLVFLLVFWARRAGCGPLGPYREVLPWRKASLLWHAAVMRRASCRLQRQAGCRVRSNRTRAGSSCLWGGDAARKLAGRARRAALVAVALRLLEECCTSGRLLSLVCISCATFQLPPPLRSRLPSVVQQVHTRRRSLSLGMRRSTRAYRARVKQRWLRSA